MDMMSGIYGDAKQPKLSDLKPEEHGPVVEIVSKYSAHGMTIGSNESGQETVKWQEDGTVLIEIHDRKYGKETYEKHLSGNDAAAKLRDYVTKSRVAEMAQIETIPCPYQMTDYSSSSHITFIYDEGSSKAYRTLDCGSYWELQRKTISKISELIRECIDTGKCLEKTENEYDIKVPMFGGMGMPCPADKQPGSWRCSCNCDNTGKFCTNCGSPRPSGKWKCPNCNTENEGRFCTECGTERG